MRSKLPSISSTMDSTGVLLSQDSGCVARNVTERGVTIARFGVRNGTLGTSCNPVPTGNCLYQQLPKLIPNQSHIYIQIKSVLEMLGLQGPQNLTISKLRFTFSKNFFSMRPIFLKKLGYVWIFFK